MLKVITQKYIAFTLGIQLGSNIGFKSQKTVVAKNNEPRIVRMLIEENFLRRFSIS